MVSRFKAHPWHGIEPGNKLPEEIRAFIEISPTDTVKYEIDKTSGYLKIDRPQKIQQRQNRHSAWFYSANLLW